MESQSDRARKSPEGGRDRHPHTDEVMRPLDQIACLRPEGSDAEGGPEHRPPDSRVPENTGGAATPDVDTALHSLRSGFGHTGRKVVKLPQ